MANSITRIEIRIDSNFGADQWGAIGEVEFYNSSGVKLSNSGITASASSEYPTWPASKALDGSLDFNSGSWRPDGSPLPQYLWFDFATASDVTTIRVYNSNEYTLEHVKDIVITATHTGGQTTSVSAARPSDVANAITSHTIPVLEATSPAPSLSANGAYITYGELAASAPAPTFAAAGTAKIFGRLSATTPPPTLTAEGFALIGHLITTVPAPTFSAVGTAEAWVTLLDSASSQDTLVTSVTGTYNHLDSHKTDDTPSISVTSTYDLLDAHTTEDGTAIVLELTILDTATHETILTRDVHITAEIIDSGRTEDGFTAWRVVEVEVYDAANNVDGAAVVWEVDLLDAVQHADLLSVNVTSTADVLDVAQALSEALGNALVELVLLDQSATQELFDYEAIRNAEILDAALAQALLGTDGDKAFYTYALNTLLNAGSRYGNHNFNSYAATDTACYAAGEGGVFLLSGDDDAGYTIPAGFRTNITDLRTETAPEGARPRSVQYAYIGMTSSGELRLKASAANGGVADTRTYRVRQTGNTFDNTTRVVMGKGVQARYWQFTIENVHGEAFDIDQIELLPVVRTRRI